MSSIRLAASDPSYPPSLLALASEDDEGRKLDPPTIYVRGALPQQRGVAIVGTRHPSPEAAAFARALSGDLARAGYAIFSGGARGIDAAAHLGALDAGGATVVVAGGGLDHPYPPEHVPLFTQILAAGGALVARVEDDVAPLPYRFLQRNAVLAAMSAATVVIEAGLKSGARSTASAARRLGRPLCVVPHAPWSPSGAGCAAELARGARATVSAADVIEAIAKAEGRAPPKMPRRKPPRAPAAPPRQTSLIAEAPRRALDPTERAVLDAMPSEAVHIENLCEISGLPFSAVAAALLTLTLDAVVVEAAVGFYRRGKR